jgi:Fur family iron response transcriptional regulator
VDERARSLPDPVAGHRLQRLNLFAQKGLLRTQPLKEGVVVFDPHVAPHHHFIDEETGKVIDIPWDAVKVTGEKTLRGLEVREYQVVLRGRKRK